MSSSDPVMGNLAVADLVMENLIVPVWPAPAGISACITTRNGGFSKGPYDSNNLGSHVGDDPDAVARNRNQLMANLGLVSSPQWLEQVHGIKVVSAKGDARVRTADGSYTNQPGQACLVMTADCLPVLLCNKAGTEVAALHCGWRSLANGICQRGLKRFTAAPRDIMAYLGPAISQPHFEVGVEVLEIFFKASRTLAQTHAVAAAFKPGARPLHFYADIYALARAELLALGVEDIYGGGYCTFAEQARFYSYRRDKTTGRMASLIWIKK